MAIHHASHAYGNLEKTQGDMSEDELLKMMGKLKEESPDKDDKQEENSVKEKEKDKK